MLIGMLATVAISRFQIYEQVDPITDGRSIYAVATAGDTSLSLGCSAKGDPSTARVVVHFDHYVGDTHPGLILGGIDLTYRFDQRSPQLVHWASHDRDVFAERTSTRPVRFMLAMKGSTTLNLRIVDPLGEQRDLAFTYPEPSFVIETVFKHCGFAPDGSIAKK